MKFVYFDLENFKELADYKLLAYKGKKKETNLSTSIKTDQKSYLNIIMSRRMTKANIAP
jgi:hypothetical protein